MQFDAVTSPIDHGLTLLEAGAGTGKTYSLVRIIARQVVEKETPIDQILTVTFTRAATAEIKSRLHDLLSEVLSHLKSPPETKINDLAHHWLSQGEEMATQAKTRLSLALASFDSAPIFTIDGFFQRLMKEYAFESQVAFSIELEPDESNLIDTALRDYWRQHVYPLEESLLEIFSSHIKFDAAKDFIGEALRNSDAEFAPEYSDPPGPLLEAYATQWRVFVKNLRTSRTALEDFVSDPPDGIKKTTTPFRKGTTEKFLDEVEQILSSPGIPLLSLGRLDSVSASVLFSEDAFNNGKFIDLSTHELADFFRSVDVIAEAAPTDLSSGYLGEIYHYVTHRLEQLKGERNVQTYNDVTAALAGLLTEESKSSDVMVTAVKRRYQAVLIDEFQDTSPQQCSIFLNLFHHPDRYFHVIGDPKQSIYRFRGADVFSYIKASERAEHRYDLLINYRSSPRMIHAVNELFSMSEDPFLVDGRIEFTPAQWQNQGLVTTPPDGPPPLYFHEIVLENGSANRIREAIGRSICHEIMDILGTPWKEFAPESDRDDRVAPSDIAILVRTTKDAGPVSEMLSSLRVPVALGTRSSLLRSDEAKEVLAVLAALLEPQNSGAVRTALLTTALGSGLLLGDDPQFDRVSSDIAELHQTWREHGLMPAMLDLVHRFEVGATLLSLVRGERRMTNLMHLVELLDAKARGEKLTPAATLQWLEMAIQGDIVDIESEVLELRIATDAPAVQILTQHTSKGLEYPIVFVLPPCPSDYTYLKPRLSYHDPDSLNACFAAQSDSAGSDIYEFRKKETSADYARLAYVALTRAQYRCHFYHIPPNADKEDEHAVHQMLGQPCSEDLQAVADASNGTIVYVPVSDEIFKERPAPFDDASRSESLQLAVRDAGSISVIRRQRTTSFTGITRFAAEMGDMPHDFDSVSGDTAMPEDTGFWAKLQAGASLGIAFHEILEELDFQNPTNLAALVEEKLLTYAPWRETPGKENLKSLIAEIEHFITRLLDHTIAGNMKLSGIPLKKRLNEARFLLSGSGFNLSALCDVLASDPPAHIPPEYLSRLSKVPESQFEGFLDGVIDLIFEHDGRYHLLDWKTNRIADASPDSLAEIMAEHHYFLQYHLYGLALDRLLAQRLGAKYNPAEHLGGVYYLFLRGAHPETPGSGVFSDTLSPTRLEALRSAFAFS